jgi:hypothetical protein
MYTGTVRGIHNGVQSENWFKFDAIKCRPSISIQKTFLSFIAFLWLILPSSILRSVVDILKAKWENQKKETASGCLLFKN